MLAGERPFEALHRNTVFLQYNSSPPAEGAYGWLKPGTQNKLSHDVQIEQNCGLYGGVYKPIPGGRKKSGLASMGAFSYSQSALPDGAQDGRYCSISTGLRFTDSVHPMNLLTTSAMAFRPRNRPSKAFLAPSLRDFDADFDLAEKSPT